MVLPGRARPSFHGRREEVAVALAPVGVGLRSRGSGGRGGRASPASTSASRLLRVGPVLDPVHLQRRPQPLHLVAGDEALGAVVVEGAQRRRAPSPPPMTTSTSAARASAMATVASTPAAPRRTRSCQLRA